MCVADVSLSGISSVVSERTTFNPDTTNRLRVVGADEMLTINKL